MPTKGNPVDDAPKIPGEFGVDSDPYTDDDSTNAGCASDEPGDDR